MSDGFWTLRDSPKPGKSMATPLICDLERASSVCVSSQVADENAAPCNKRTGGCGEELFRFYHENNLPDLKN